MDGALDFYVIAFTSNGSSPITYRLINQYAYPATATALPLVARLTNFYSSGSDRLTGEKFPTILRITGTIPTGTGASKK